MLLSTAIFVGSIIIATTFLGTVLYTVKLKRDVEAYDVEQDVHWRREKEQFVTLLKSYNEFLKEEMSVDKNVN